MYRTLLIAFALVGATLSAQTITGGLHTGLTLPVGDLKDKQDWGTNQFFGAHIGGHLDFILTPRHEVRGVVTFQKLPGSGWGGNSDFKNDYTALQVGADWVYHFQSLNQGWFTVAGASINSLKNETEYNAGGRRFSVSNTQSGKLGVRGGGGYTFNSLFSLEGTLNQIMVDKNLNDGFGFDTATWVQVSAVFRFGR